MIRVALSEPYPDWESQKAIIDTLLRVLEIPDRATHEVAFFTPTQGREVVNDPTSVFVWR